jgi:hypothetical protein
MFCPWELNWIMKKIRIWGLFKVVYKTALVLLSKSCYFESSSQRSVKKKNVKNIIMYIESRLMLSLVNVISHLMWSHFEITFTIAYYMNLKATGFCYHSAIVITCGMVKSDHIKRLPLYLQKGLNGNTKCSTV